MNQLINLIHSPGTENWSERCKSAFEALFGADGGRYPEKARNTVSLRAPTFKPGKGVAYASLIQIGRAHV